YDGFVREGGRLTISSDEASMPSTSPTMRRIGSSNCACLVAQATKFCLQNKAKKEILKQAFNLLFFYRLFCKIKLSL
ncbi:MAG: hypothetical protein IKV38_00515, partial [Clostridia bacterium]|nr:hypothetical protein [Clostridia bacterium]